MPAPPDWDAMRADDLSAADLAEILQAYLIEVLEHWNADHALDRPLTKLPWSELDPVSRALYVERAALFLKEYLVTRRAN